MKRGFVAVVVLIALTGSAGAGADGNSAKLRVSDARAAVRAYGDYWNRSDGAVSKTLGCKRRGARRVGCRVRTVGALLNPEEGDESPKMEPFTAIIETRLTKPRLRRVSVWDPDFVERCVWQPRRAFRCKGSDVQFGRAATRR